MKTNFKINDWRLFFIFSVISFLLLGCRSDEPSIKVNIIATSAIQVKINSAILSADVQSNFSNASLYCQYKAVDSLNWSIKNLNFDLTSNEITRIESEVNNLLANTDYEFRFVTENLGQKNIGEKNYFSTYSVVDANGNYYNSVQIGDQVWLKENFKGTSYADGSLIKKVVDAVNWNILTTEAYCWYENNQKNAQTYGNLYNFYTVSNQRELITGWHVPSASEWEDLILYLGGSEQAAIKIMESGTGHWLKPEVKATNESGFSALPNGQRNCHIINEFIFFKITENAMWWSSTYDGSTNKAGAATIYEDNCLVNYSYDRRSGFGIRLLKNK